ncbi:MAG TPA: glycosyltransferase family 87 protein [Roseomonas sp.]|jgi:hypothetical protein
MEPTALRGSTPDAWPVLALVWACGFVLFAAYALWLGQDANWDLQNYHDYGPHALLTGRYRLDVGPAGIQGYFNPLPYVIPYLLRHALPPVPAALGLVAIQALTVTAAWMLAGALAPPGSPRPILLRSLATLTGIASAMALSEIGTSFADLALAAPVLWGLLALLRAWEGGDRRLFLLAGMLVGAAAGLKLTNFIFAAGLAAATILPWRGLAASLAAAWRVGLGGIAGILLTGGAWGAYLWITLGNPVFPAMNQVFQSPSAIAQSFADPRFLPAGLAEALRYPLDIARGTHPTAELPFNDPRLLFALSLSVLLLALPVLTGRLGAAPAQPGAARAGQHRVMVFLLASCVAWLSTFGIHRYALLLDILGGMLLVVVPATLLPGRRGLGIGFALAAITLAATRPADWFHRAWGDAYTPVPPHALEGGATFLVTHSPLGYWVAALPKASRFYTVLDNGIAGAGPLQARIEAGLRAPVGGRLWTLGKDEPMLESTRSILARYGVVPTGPCLRAPAWWDATTVFCGASRNGSRPLAAPTLALGESAGFTNSGSGWTYLVARTPPDTPGWRPPTAEGTASENGARLVLRPAATAVPRLLAFELRRPGPAHDDSRVKILANGQPAAEWAIPAGPDWSIRLLCLPPDDPALGGVMDLYFLDPESPGPGHEPGFLLRRMTLRPAAPAECPP